MPIPRQYPRLELLFFEKEVIKMGRLISNILLIVVIVAAVLYSVGFVVIDEWNEQREIANSCFDDGSVFYVKAFYDREFQESLKINPPILSGQKERSPEGAIEAVVQRISASWKRQFGITFLVKEIVPFESRYDSPRLVLERLRSKEPPEPGEIFLVFSGKNTQGFLAQPHSLPEGDCIMISYSWPYSGDEYAWPRKINPNFRDPYFVERSAYRLNWELAKAFGFLQKEAPEIVIPERVTEQEIIALQNELMKESLWRYFWQRFSEIFPLNNVFDIKNQEAQELMASLRQQSYQKGYETGFDEGLHPGHAEVSYPGMVTLELKEVSGCYEKGYQEGLAEGRKFRWYRPKLEDPTLQEVRLFLEKNLIDQRVYDPQEYVCRHYARDLVNQAGAEGIRAGYVVLLFPPTGYVYTGHAIVCFEVPDYGLVFFEPQSDAEVTVELDKSYFGQNGMFSFNRNDYIQEIEITWPDGTTEIIK